MQRVLSQKEIDNLVEALSTLKKYGNSRIIADDILNNQIVLTQSEIDSLITTLLGALGQDKDFAPSKPDLNVVLSQSEIDSLIEALNSIREFDENIDISQDLGHNQTVLTQSEIDKLIDKLRAMMLLDE